MNFTNFLRSMLLVGSVAATPVAQEWSDDQLIAAAGGFQNELPIPRLQQIGALVAERPAMFSALIARIHGDHREYKIKVERLLAELGDERWAVREQAERTLIEIGGPGRSRIEECKEKYDVLEQSWRCARILDVLTAKGTEQEDRELRLLRGLVSTSLYLDADPRLLRALRSAVGSNDMIVVDAAIRALGKLGGDEEADAVLQFVTGKEGSHRLVSVAALGRMRGEKALAACRQLLTGNALNATEQVALLRALHMRNEPATTALLAELAKSPEPRIAAAASLVVEPSTEGTHARFTLPDRDRTQVTAVFGGFAGESTFLRKAIEGLDVAELAFGDCDTIDFPDHALAPTTQSRIFLNQGSLVAGEVIAIDPEAVRVKSSLFGNLVLPRGSVQGIATDPNVDRMIGSSVEHDRVRLRNGEFVDGKLLTCDKDKLRIEVKDKSVREHELSSVAAILFTRPRMQDPDATTYTRLDLVSGERLIGFVVGSSGTQLGVVVPGVGSAALPLGIVSRAELGVGGGAMWGFTLISDYSDNRIVEVDDQGREGFVLEDVFGAWDAECLDSGNLLITEFSVSRVREVDRKGNTVWVFEDLKNPYDADRLPNGNTLIADTFGSRVIEVGSDGKIIWSYDKDIRPFDCDRLANGNTLIANVLKDCVIEVNPEGEIVWEVKNLPNVHDADRLPNGNTLVTLRNKGAVLELDREGRTVWELQGLSSPSDADRLPNGHTIVAENNRVREFDRRGNEVWRKDMTWAVEANRY